MKMEDSERVVDLIRWRNDATKALCEIENSTAGECVKFTMWSRDGECNRANGLMSAHIAEAARIEIQARKNKCDRELEALGVELPEDTEK